MVSDTAWKNGGGPEYRAALKQAVDDAHAGSRVLIVWALDRIVREGAEDALRVFRQFRQRGCIVVSVKESWLKQLREGIASAAALAVVAEEIAWVHQDLEETRHPSGTAEHRRLAGEASKSASKAREIGRTLGD